MAFHKRKKYSLIEQLTPIYELGQSHIYSVRNGLHFPPFLHGLEKQGSIETI